MNTITLISGAGTIKVGDIITMPGKERTLWRRFLRRIGLINGPIKPWSGRVASIL